MLCVQGQDGERERVVCVVRARFFPFWKRPGGRLLPSFCSEKRPGGAISEFFYGPPREAFTPFFTVPFEVPGRNGTSFLFNFMSSFKVRLNIQPEYGE